MDKTTVGQQRCVDHGDEAQLFVVEWDATDAATFQSQARRDLVFVHYADCKLRIIEGCKDDNLAGRYGTYRELEPTSGGEESFAVRTQDELSAKLPLGVASLSGAVAQQKALELKYRVAGKVSATRADVYKQDLAHNPGCGQATHVVSGYALGAFRLLSQDASRAAGGVGVAGAGVGASHQESSDVLRKAGDFSACAQVDNHACRVPIRLSLRPLQDGSPPEAVASQAVSPANSEDTLKPVMQKMDAEKNRFAAEQHLAAGDAEGCLKALSQADAKAAGSKLARLQLRAVCTMRAGRCDEGKGLFRQARQAWYRDHNPSGLATEAVIDREVEQKAAEECATRATGGMAPLAAGQTLTREILLAAGRKDTATCISAGDKLLKVLDGAPPGMPTQLAASGLQHAARCAAAGGKCVEAKRFYVPFAQAFLKFSRSAADKAFAVNFKQCAK